MGVAWGRMGLAWGWHGVGMGLVWVYQLIAYCNLIDQPIGNLLAID
jgi:hypothetical protein